MANAITDRFMEDVGIDQDQFNVGQPDALPRDCSDRDPLQHDPLSRRPGEVVDSAALPLWNREHLPVLPARIRTLHRHPLPSWHHGVRLYPWRLVDSLDVVHATRLLSASWSSTSATKLARRRRSCSPTASCTCVASAASLGGSGYSHSWAPSLFSAALFTASACPTRSATRTAPFSRNSPGSPSESCISSQTRVLIDDPMKGKKKSRIGWGCLPQGRKSSEFILESHFPSLC